MGLISVTWLISNYAMKRIDLLRVISRAAMEAGLPWVMTREGGNHSIFTLSETPVQIPRHRDIDELTAKAIMKHLEKELGAKWWNR